MPSTSKVPSRLAAPGSRQLRLLVAGLVAAGIASVLSWASLRRLEASAERTLVVSEMQSTLERIRAAVLQTSINSRGFAITGDTAQLRAAVVLADSLPLLVEELRIQSRSITEPREIQTLAGALDSASARVHYLEALGADGAAAARALVSSGSGTRIRNDALRELTSLDSTARAYANEVATASNRNRLAVRIWLPVAAVLGLVVAVLALNLLRVQVEARRKDLTRYRAIFDNTFQFIGLLDLDGRLIEANKTAVSFAGVKDEDVIGRLFWDTPWFSYSPEVQAQLQAAFRSAVRGQFVRYAVDVVGAEGRVLTIDFSLKPVLSADGTVEYVVPEGRDITEHQAAEARAAVLQQQLTALLEHSPTYIALFDLEGRYLVASASVARLFGIPSRELIGKSVEEVRPAATAAIFRARVRQLDAAGAPIEVEDTIGSGESALRYRSVLFPVLDAAGRRFATGNISVDVTETYRALQRVEKTLEERETLLREVHHRVKNNLQVVSSILSL